MSRVRIKYRKAEMLRWLSHMETYRAWMRIIRRSEIPIRYSEGFSPHPKISLGPALPVGVGSEAEYMDIKLEGEMAAATIRESINSEAPDALRVLGAKVIPDKTKSLGATIKYSDYRFYLLNGSSESTSAQERHTLESSITGQVGKNRGQRIECFAWSQGNEKEEQKNMIDFVLRLPVSIRVKDTLIDLHELPDLKDCSFVVDRVAQWIDKDKMLAEPLQI